MYVDTLKTAKMSHPRQLAWMEIFNFIHDSITDLVPGEMNSYTISEDSITVTSSWRDRCGDQVEETTKIPFDVLFYKADRVQWARERAEQEKAEAARLKAKAEADAARYRRALDRREYERLRAQFEKE